EHAVELAALARELEPLGGTALAADLHTARLLAGAAAQAAHGNVRANAALAAPDAAARAVETANALLERLAAPARG
ncbi:MAG TPA: hypothetical protein VFX50_09915, partial [Gemmatimonadales bacterium]|nr:hypothetical protein [Gemmatimonadales bacterium]